MWPGANDHPYIANQLSHLGCAFELLQERTGPNIGQTTARGVYIDGSEAAQARELKQVLTDAFGEPDQRMREEMGKLRIRVEEDMTHGDAWKVMQSFGELGSADKLFWEA